VLHFASSDHVGAAKAIKAGLEKGKGGYWIHTSGTDILLKPELLSGKGVEQGVSDVKVYDDWEGIREVISFPGSSGPPFALCSDLIIDQEHILTVPATRSHFPSPHPKSKQLSSAHRPFLPLGAAQDPLAPIRFMSWLV
jgi:hypothetical protein